MRVLICAGLLWLAMTMSSVAADLDQAKAGGLLGEQIDGYLGLVDGDAPADIKALMNDVNAKRLAKYSEIAAARGVTVDAVGKITAEKVFEKAAPGTYLLDSTGLWKRK